MWRNATHIGARTLPLGQDPSHIVLIITNIILNMSIIRLAGGGGGGGCVSANVCSAATWRQGRRARERSRNDRRKKRITQRKKRQEFDLGVAGESGRRAAGAEGEEGLVVVVQVAEEREEKACCGKEKQEGEKEGVDD